MIYHDLPFAVEVFHSTFLDYRYHFPKAFHWGRNPKWHLHGRESTEEHPKNQPHRIDGENWSRWHQNCPSLVAFLKVGGIYMTQSFIYIYICPSIARKLAILFLHNRADPVERDWDGSKMSPQILGLNLWIPFILEKKMTLYIYEDVVSMIFNHGLFMITSYIIWSNYMFLLLFFLRHWYLGRSFNMFRSWFKFHKSFPSPILPDVLCTTASRIPGRSCRSRSARVATLHPDGANESTDPRCSANLDRGGRCAPRRDLRPARRDPRSHPLISSGSWGYHVFRPTQVWNHAVSRHFGMFYIPKFKGLSSHKSMFIRGWHTGLRSESAFYHILSWFFVEHQWFLW